MWLGLVPAIPSDDYLVPRQPKWELSRTTSPVASLILRLPTTADVFGHLHRTASHIGILSLWGLSLTGIIRKTI